MKNVIAACNISFFKTINSIEVQKYLFGIEYLFGIFGFSAMVKEADVLLTR